MRASGGKQATMMIQPDQQFFDGGRYVWTPERERSVWQTALRVLAQTLKRGKMRRIVMMIGLPGSGKSSYAEAHDERDVVLLDSAFVDKQRRAEVFAVAGKAGVPVVGVWMDTEWEVCDDRNRQKNADQRVPAEMMRRMRAALLAETPSETEGFAEIRRIRTHVPAAA
jgi:predicted kinase